MGDPTRTARGVDVYKLFRKMKPQIDPEDLGEPMPWEKALYRAKRDDGYALIRDMTGKPLVLVLWDGSSFTLFGAPGAMWPRSLEGWNKYRQAKRLIDEIGWAVRDGLASEPGKATYYRYSRAIKNLREERRDPHGGRGLDPGDRDKAERYVELWSRKRDRVLSEMLRRVAPHVRGRGVDDPAEWEVFRTDMRRALDRPSATAVNYALEKSLQNDRWYWAIPPGPRKALEGVFDLANFGEELDVQRQSITTEDALANAVKGITEWEKRFQAVLEAHYDKLLEETSPSPLPLRSASMKSLRAKVVRLAHANPELRPHLLPLLKTARDLVKQGAKLIVRTRRGDTASIQTIPVDDYGQVYDAALLSKNLNNRSKRAFRAAMAYIEENIASLARYNRLYDAVADIDDFVEAQGLKAPRWHFYSMPD